MSTSPVGKYAESKLYHHEVVCDDIRIGKDHILICGGKGKQARIYSRDDALEVFKLVSALVDSDVDGYALQTEYPSFGKVQIIFYFSHSSMIIAKTGEFTPEVSKIRCGILKGQNGNPRGAVWQFVRQIVIGGGQNAVLSRNINEKRPDFVKK